MLDLRSHFISTSFLFPDRDRHAYAHFRSHSLAIAFCLTQLRSFRRFRRALQLLHHVGLLAREADEQPQAGRVRAGAGRRKSARVLGGGRHLPRRWRQLCESVDDAAAAGREPKLDTLARVHWRICDDLHLGVRGVCRRL